MRRVPAAELLIGQLHRGQRAQAQPARRVARQRVDAVIEHLAGEPAVRRRAHPVAVEKVGGGRGEVRPERVAQVVFEGTHHVGHAAGDGHSLAVRRFLVLAVLGAGAQERPQFVIAREIRPERAQELVGILRALGDEPIDGDEGIRHHRKAVDQAAAAVVAGALMNGIAHVIARFQTAHHGGEERYREVRNRAGRAVGSRLHLLQEALKVFIKPLADVPKPLQRGNRLHEGAHLVAGDEGDPVRQRQLQDLGQVQPGVGGVAVVLAHDERLLTPGDGVVRKVLFLNARQFQRLEHAVVIEQRRREAAGREEESAHLAVEPLGRVLMKLDRQDRLRQVHFVVGVKERVAGLARQVVPFHIPPADD